MNFSVALTHPDFSEAALTQFELQPQRLPGNLPGIFSKSLRLRLDRGANCGQPVAEPVSVLCENKTQRSKCYVTVTHKHVNPVRSASAFTASIYMYSTHIVKKQHISCTDSFHLSWMKLDDL